MLIQQVLIGLIFIGLGTITLKYNYQLVNNTTRLQFIESRLGAGSTYLFWKLVSIAMILGGILYMTGFGDDLWRSVTAPLINLLSP